EKEHRQKDPEEERGRADVLLEDHHDHRDRPHGHDRDQVRDRRDRERADAARRAREHLAVLLEIGGEEDDEEELHRLPRLDRRGTDLDPDPRAVDLAPDHRQQRRDEEEKPGDRERRDPEEQRELGEARARDRETLRPDHCSSRSATRPIATSSPYWTRSRDRTTSPFTRVPFVLPESSIHHSPSANSRRACFAEAASSLRTTSFPASRPIAFTARSGRRSPTRGAPRTLRWTTRCAMPEGRAATASSLESAA